MSKWSTYPFMRITIFFILGILSYQFFTEFNSYYWSIFLLLIFICYRIISYKSFVPANSIFSGAMILSLCFLFGLQRKSMDDPVLNPNHLLNKNVNEEEVYLLRIDSYAVIKEKYLLYEVELMASIHDELHTPLEGRINLYVMKDSINNSMPIYGDVLMTGVKPFLISSPGNPHEFDYQSFMKLKGIRHQLFVKKNEFLIVDNIPENSFLQLSFNARNYLKVALNKFLIHDHSISIAMALVLGIKDGLGPELKSAYSSAGAMHVLAVSGLHVGIIYMICGWVFGFLKRWALGRYFFLTLSLILLWGYALITGLSPSVLRAVIMFSIVAIGDSSLKNHNIYNTLSVSAFFILLYDPNMLWQVGFQLSYLAVIGIVYLHPKIFQLLKFKNVIVKWFWSITCVSIAAQIATFPLGLFYFHQFPTYFLISNLVVIPAAFLILFMSIFLIAASFLSEVIGKIMGFLLSYLIEGLNICVLWINDLPFNKVDWITIDFWQLLLIYLVISFMMLLIYQKRAVYLRLSLLGCLAFSIISINQVYAKHWQKQIVFYEIRENSVIDFIGDGQVNSYMSDENQDLELLNYQIGPNRLANFLPPLSKSQFYENATKLPGFGDVIIWREFKLMVLKEKIGDIELNDKVSVDFLVLSENQFVDVDKLLKQFSFKQLIIDGTYSRYKANYLQNRFEELGYESWNIKEDGAFVFKIDS